MQQIVYTFNIINDLRYILDAEAADRIVLLTDTTTHEVCRPLLDGIGFDAEITIGATDAHKTIDSLQQVWEGLQAAGCTRHSLLVNLGGGMVTDLGGFAAATFKRGIRFINIPTTLLSMVDAAVGGKTGINFRGLKNEIGAFAEARVVVIHTRFLQTLDTENIRSGYAEMLKHSLLESPEFSELQGDEPAWQRHLAFNLADPDYNELQDLVRESIEVKQNIVTEDPHEQGLRKALNLGHTVGHALESLLMQRGTPVLHGYAVAWGLVASLFTSAAQSGFPTDVLRAVARFVTDHYGRPAVTCDDYEALYALMLHDKKNTAGCINFTLLSSPGVIHIDQQADKALIFDAIDFLRES